MVLNHTCNYLGVPGQRCKRAGTSMGVALPPSDGGARVKSGQWEASEWSVSVCVSLCAKEKLKLMQS